MWSGSSSFSILRACWGSPVPLSTWRPSWTAWAALEAQALSCNSLIRDQGPSTVATATPHISSGSHAQCPDPRPQPPPSSPRGGAGGRGSLHRSPHGGLLSGSSADASTADASAAVAASPPDGGLAARRRPLAAAVATAGRHGGASGTSRGPLLAQRLAGTIAIARGAPEPASAAAAAWIRGFKTTTAAPMRFAGTASPSLWVYLCSVW